jgi:GNAT superfamily N-acetyltransferase
MEEQHPRDQPVQIEAHPDSRDLASLEEQLNHYNIATTGYQFDGEVAAFVRDAEGTIIAGISGWAWGGILKIQHLWVREDWRGHDLGTRLLQAAEDEGRRRGCRQATLDTHSFQAPGFYQKLGYEVYGVLDDDPVGYQHYYLRKKLQRLADSPGL